MNTPNKLSLTRILAIPAILLFLLPIEIGSFSPEAWNLFVLSEGRWIAGVLFILASITDYADGKIARKNNLVTNLGKFLDALADKMLVLSVFIALVGMGRLASVWVILIVFREVMVTGLRGIAVEQGVVIAAKMPGKIKTVTQMIAIIFILFETLFVKIPGLNHPNLIQNVGDVLFYICIVMTVYSGADYLIKHRKTLTEPQ